jgi:hypothetical protein
MDRGLFESVVTVGWSGSPGSQNRSAFHWWAVHMARIKTRPSAVIADINEAIGTRDGSDRLLRLAIAATTSYWHGERLNAEQPSPLAWRGPSCSGQSFFLSDDCRKVTHHGLPRCSRTAGRWCSWRDRGMSFPVAPLRRRRNSARDHCPSDNFKRGQHYAG